MKRIQWLIYGSDYVFRKYMNSFYFVPYCKQKMLSTEQGNDALIKRISDKEPFFAGRLGLFELAAMRAFEFHNTSKYDVVMKQIYECAGFFPLDISLGEKFSREMKEALKQCDLLACSYNLCENYFMNNYLSKDAVGINSFGVFEPWRFENPWSACLSGKKVLVVTPFTESVKEQYEKCERLFQGTEILPQFDLLTYQALMTTGDFIDERFATWFDALEYMYEEIMKIDFDIVLLGCGAYGFPLGAKIKASGKQAIHMGGVLQILFGIMGKRWDGTGPNSVTHKVREDIAKYYNEAWTYPKANETPVGSTRIEYGPYWK